MKNCPSTCHFEPVEESEPLRFSLTSSPAHSEPVEEYMLEVNFAT